MIIRYLLEKEFKQIFRNPFLPRLFVLFPTMMLLVMPWAANQEVKNLKLSVMDNDRSACSERLVQKAGASRYFRLTDVSSSNEEALHNIETDNADLILEIEQDFEKSLVTTGAGRVIISANAVNGTKSSLGSSYLGSIVSDFAADLNREEGFDVQGQGSQFSVAPHYRFNPHLDYKVFMVPALIGMMLTLLAGFLPALNIVGEKEKGTIEQINVTPVSKFSFIISKLIPYWVVGFCILSYAMLLAWLVYDLTPVGNPGAIYLFASIYILVVSGLGLVISNSSVSMQQALFVMFFFMMTFLLMSGLFTPITGMPEWAQMITLLNPMRYLIEVMRMVYLKGSTFAELMPHFRALCLFAIGFNLWAILSYRKSS